MLEAIQGIGIIVIVAVLVIGLGVLVMVSKFYRKVEQGQALIRNGWRGTRISFGGQLVIPILHRVEVMDISVKRVMLERTAKDGLICKDNLRADIKVAFFVRVNDTVEDVTHVAKTIGVERASDRNAIVQLFDPKFSEALKTVGKKFEFVDLYQERAQFKDEILQVIGTDLNGYILDDCAIDYLEQTDIHNLSADNILDSEGIKKITELTAQQKILANQIDRDREKTIKRQDVEAEEAVLELDRQLEESKERQKREVSSIAAREQAETFKVQQEERLKAESARIQTEEELNVAEENKNRQVIVASKNKERTDKVESERIEKDRMLEVIERERVVELTKIEKDRAVEVERKNIQDVIRDRVMVEKAVVEEEEKIKDTKAFAEAERTRQVAVVSAQTEAEEERVKEVAKAQADKESAALKAEQHVIEAEAARKASDKNAEARKVLAEAQAAEDATIGIAEAQVQEAKAQATQMEGEAQAKVIEMKANAEANGMTAKAVALEKEGSAEAAVIQKKAEAEARGEAARAEALERVGSAEANNLLKKYKADADGIREKAEAMKNFDDAGRDHEEFKLRLQTHLETVLADLGTRKEIAAAQAEIIAKGLEAADIEIIGGDNAFFDKLAGAVAQGRAVDRMVHNSTVLTDVKDTFFNGDPEYFKQQLRGFIDKFGISSEDLKNLSVAALISRMMNQTEDEGTKGMLGQILTYAQSMGLGDKPAGLLG